VAEGERVVSVGQDSLSDGTPIEVLGDPGSALPVMAGPTGNGAPDRAAGTVGQGGRAAGPQPGGDFEMTPERLAVMKQRMRERGMSDEQIEQRIERMRQRFGARENGSSGRGRVASDSDADGPGH